MIGVFDRRRRRDQSGRGRQGIGFRASFRGLRTRGHPFAAFGGVNRRLVPRRRRRRMGRHAGRTRPGMRRFAEVARIGKRRGFQDSLKARIDTLRTENREDGEGCQKARRKRGKGSEARGKTPSEQTLEISDRIRGRLNQKAHGRSRHRKTAFEMRGFDESLPVPRSDR